MAQHSTVRRYAAAAFQLAQEQGKPDKWQADLSALAEMWSNDDLLAFLSTPAISPGRKLQFVHDLLPGAEPHVHNLVGVMLNHGLISALPQVAAEFQRLVDAQQGVSRAAVTTAVPVSETLIGQIKTWLESSTGKSLIAQAGADPSLVGGFVARVGDRLIDASTRSQLQQLREKLSTGESSV
jgi:F-type H+-transporting ATPase subunit delta